MKIKTSKLAGPTLDWAVAKCEGVEAGSFYGLGGYATDWARGGPIIERERIAVVFKFGWLTERNIWIAETHNRAKRATPYLSPTFKQHGKTPLVAAMRCYVASRLGDEVEIPSELI
jgi:hypothetical protein